MFLDLPGGNHLLTKLTISLQPMRAVHKLREMCSKKVSNLFFLSSVLSNLSFRTPGSRFSSCAGERHRQQTGRSALRPKTKICFSWWAATRWGKSPFIEPGYQCSMTNHDKANRNPNALHSTHSPVYLVAVAAGDSDIRWWTPVEKHWRNWGREEALQDIDLLRRKWKRQKRYCMNLLEAFRKHLGSIIAHYSLLSFTLLTFSFPLFPLFPICRLRYVLVFPKFYASWRGLEEVGC